MLASPGLVRSRIWPVFPPQRHRYSVVLESVLGATAVTPGGPLWGNTVSLLASRQRLPCPRSLPGSRLGALRLLPPDSAFHVGFGPKDMFYAVPLRFTYERWLVSGWAVIIEKPNLFDLPVPSVPPPGGAGLVLPPG